MFKPRRAIAVFVLGIAVAVTTSACDADEVGTAAVVGNNRISISELQDMTRKVADRPGSPFDINGDLTELQGRLLQQEIHNNVMGELAAAEGVQISEAQVDQVLDEQYVSQTDDFGAALIQNGFTMASLRDAVRSQLEQGELLQKLGNDPDKLTTAYGDMAKELGVKVNPRYGEWNETQLEQVSGSVSKALEPQQEPQQQEGEAPTP